MEKPMAKPQAPPHCPPIPSPGGVIFFISLRVLSANPAGYAQPSEKNTATVP